MLSFYPKKIPSLALGFIISFIAYANPEGGIVVGGSATIVENSNQLDIYQYSDKAIIDWDSFDIDVDEITNIHQPSNNSILLNRITGSDPSIILGNITANGNVILINPNGVIFGPNSVVDVNGLIATTSNISNADFMAGNLIFSESGDPTSFIINQGQISAKEAGLVALVAPNVVNNGVISAKLGRVELASGTSFSVDLYGDGLYELNISDEVASQLISNTGSLSAEGGVIAITAAAGQEIVNSLITIEGELNAPTIEEKSGKIIISAAGSNSVDGNVEEDKAQIEGYSTVVIDNAYLNASGRDEGEQGGKISITGDAIYILDDAVIDASGDSSIALSDGSDGTATMTADKTVVDEATFLESEYRAGGSIKIGGDYLGGGDTSTSLFVYVDEDAYILNDAITSGDGGRTIIWSDDTTEFYGNVFASGGSEGGNGGFLETSGKEHLSALGYADLTAIEGYNKGTYLLDPANITIYGNSTFSPDDIANGVMWLDASQLTGYVDGDAISVWDDEFGQGNDAIQYGSEELPVYVTDAGNGMASILFTQDRLTTSNSFTFDDFSVFVVFNDNGVDGSHERLVDHSYSDGFWLGRDGANPDTFGGGVQEGAPYYGRFVTTTDGDWNILGSQRSDTTHTIWNNGDFDNGASGNVVNTTTTSNPIIIGGSVGGVEFKTDLANDIYISEIIIYSDDITTEERSLLEQYQATKWDIEIDSSGHSAFTTDYLEHLSATADIILQADDTITLDLQGDTLTLDADRSITLTTTNGDITDVSSGTITTSQTTTGGNITIDAGGSIALDSTNLVALNGGVVTLSAADTIDVSQTSTLNLGTLSSSNDQTITLSSTNDITFNADLTLQEVLTATATGDVILNAGISTTEDMILQANDNITLDLNANTISLTDDGSITLKTITGDITDVSSGTIETNQTTTGGNITINAGGAISLDTTNLSALNGGVVTLSAADNIDVSQTSTLNLGNLSSSNDQAITISSTNDIVFNTALTLQEVLTATAGGGMLLDTGMSSTKDITLEADTITLDLQGNAISVDNTNNASIKLTATAGSITDDSNGTIETDGGNITLNASGDISLGTTNLETSNGGVVNLSTGDAIDMSQTSALNLGNLSSSNDQAITLRSTNDIVFNTALTLQEMLTATAGGDIILNADISTSSTLANAIQLSSASNFINNAGSGALTTLNSNWIVHSNAFSNNQRNGLLPDESLFGQANITDAISTASANKNIFAYSTTTQPTLTYTVQDNSVEMGNALTATTISYTSGLESGDTEGTIGASGEALLNTSYTTNTGEGFYPDELNATAGTLSNVLGYQYVFIAGGLTVTAPVVTTPEVTTPEVTTPEVTTPEITVSNTFLHQSQNTNTRQPVQTILYSLDSTNIENNITIKQASIVEMIVSNTPLVADTIKNSLSEIGINEKDNTLIQQANTSSNTNSVFDLTNPKNKAASNIPNLPKVESSPSLKVDVKSPLIAKNRLFSTEVEELKQRPINSNGNSLSVTPAQEFITVTKPSSINRMKTTERWYDGVLSLLMYAVMLLTSAVTFLRLFIILFKQKE